MSGLTMRPNKTTGRLELSAEANETENRSRVIDNFEVTFFELTLRVIRFKRMLTKMIFFLSKIFYIAITGIENSGKFQN
jgi:hypothetical protein